jgi:hypothetical protein
MVAAVAAKAVSATTRSTPMRVAFMTSSWTGLRIARELGLLGL